MAPRTGRGGWGCLQGDFFHVGFSNRQALLPQHGVRRTPGDRRHGRKHGRRRDAQHHNGDNQLHQGHPALRRLVLKTGNPRQAHGVVSIKPVTVWTLSTKAPLAILAVLSGPAAPPRELNVTSNAALTSTLSGLLAA